MIKHDYVHNKPTPSPKEGESWLEATLAGLTLIAATVVWCAVLYLLLHTGTAASLRSSVGGA